MFKKSLRPQNSALNRAASPWPDVAEGLFRATGSDHCARMLSNASRRANAAYDRNTNEYRGLRSATCVEVE